MERQQKNIMYSNREFLKERDIQWLPVLIKVEDGKKKFMSQHMRRWLGYTPTYTDFTTLEAEELEGRMTRFFTNYKNWKTLADGIGAYWVMGIDTSTYTIIDVDDESYVKLVSPLLENCPYYFSTQKRLPKIFVLDSKMAIEVQQQNVKFQGGNVEAQKGQWSYLDFHTPIMNAEKEIPDVDVRAVLGPPTSCVRKVQEDTTPQTPMATDIPLSFFDFSRAFKLCGCLNPSRWDEWESWYQIAVILNTDSFPYNYEVWRYYSSQSDKYEAENFEIDGKDYNLYHSIRPRPNGLTMGSLYFWAKEDNPEEFDRHFGRSYEAVKGRIESTYGLSKLNDPISYLVRGVDGNLQMLGKEKLEQRFYEEYSIGVNEKTGDDERKFFVGQWLLDEKKKSYEKLTFNPSPLTDTRFYNTYRGLTVHNLVNPTYQQEYVDEINKFVEERLCGGDAKFAEWFRWWLAHIIQKPWEMTRVCPIIKSREGIGKNLFLTFIGEEILGYYLSLARLDKVLGRFNSILESKLLINLNEVSYADVREDTGKLYEMIADKWITIEKKGVNPYKMENCANYIATTNKDCPLPVSHSARRVVCCETDAPKLTTEEATRLASLFTNPDAIYSYYYFLNTLELPKKSLEDIRPITKYYEDCKRISASPLISFWIYYLTNDKALTKDHFVYMNALYEEYKTWKEKYHPSGQVISSKMFSRELLSNIPERCAAKRKKTRNSGIDVYVSPLTQFLEEEGYLEKSPESLLTARKI
jgi:hypothetical protein